MSLLCYCFSQLRMKIVEGLLASIQIWWVGWDVQVDEWVSGEWLGLIVYCWFRLLHLIGWFGSSAAGVMLMTSLYYHLATVCLYVSQC
jgi:hypothetical protein